MYRFRENSIAAVFQNQALRLPVGAYAAHVAGDRTVETTWEEMKERVRSLSYYLLSIGIKRADRIAIYSDNRIEWRIAALAVASVGAIDVPIAPDARPREIAYILGHSHCRVCFVDSELRLEKLLPTVSALPQAVEIIVFDHVPTFREKYRPFEGVLSEGAGNPVRHHMEGRIQETGPDDVSTIVYSRKSAGNPDGAMLSHGSLLSAARSFLLEMEDPYTRGDLITENDLFYSVLSPVNLLERTIGFYASICRGATTFLSSGTHMIGHDFARARPSLLVCDEETLGLIRNALLLNIDLLSAIGRKQFHIAVRRTLRNARRMSRPGMFGRIENGLLHRAFFAGMKKGAGLDRCRYLITEVGAPPDRHTEIFEAIGMKILYCYGASSTHTLTHFNRPWNNRPGTAGQPLFNTETIVAENGEVLIKSPHVFSGYHLDDKKTRDTFTPDGFYKTSDFGRIDSEDFLYLSSFVLK